MRTPILLYLFALAVRAAIAARVRHVLVDEYQDVNPVQERLVTALHSLGANLCVVGDDDQHIYHWRGTDLEQMLSFPDRYPGVVRIPLATNFRSTDTLVAASRRMAERNRVRVPKAMTATGDRIGDRGELLCLRFDSPEAEARWIANRIVELRGTAYAEGGRQRGLSWSDCAVLLRSVRLESGPYVAALKAAGVPVVVAGAGSLLDSPEALAAASLFWYLLRRFDRSELARHWRDADLGVTAAGIEAGLSLLDSLRTRSLSVPAEELGLQRVYSDFLTTVGLREPAVPHARGEIAYSRLGGFSRVLSDFESICLRGRPGENYEALAGFLMREARDFYADTREDAQFLQQDAVLVTTVHQAKGLEFPVVVLAGQRASRFVEQPRPSPLWRLVPRGAIRNPERYDDSLDAERRLYYVGVTRSERYLYCTWSPASATGSFSRPSPLWSELAADPAFATAASQLVPADKLTPEPRRSQAGVALTFSDLKYYLCCPYQFKLKALYGFDAPTNAAIGYGRSLHNVLADVHRRVLQGEHPSPATMSSLLATHWKTPYAEPAALDRLQAAANACLARYLTANHGRLPAVAAVELPVQVTAGDDVQVSGRIDLVRRDADTITLVDFKSVEEAQARELTQHQLRTYALGYEQLRGHQANWLEAYNLEDGNVDTESGLTWTAESELDVIRSAGAAIRVQDLPACPLAGECVRCDARGVCAGPKATLG